MPYKCKSFWFGLGGFYGISIIVGYLKPNSIDCTLSGTTTLGQSRPASNDNEGVLSIDGVSPSDCLESYPQDSFVEFYPSAEVQSVYSTDPPTGFVNYSY